MPAAFVPSSTAPLTAPAAAPSAAPTAAARATFFAFLRMAVGRFFAEPRFLLDFLVPPFLLVAREELDLLDVTFLLVFLAGMSCLPFRGWYSIPNLQQNYTDKIRSTNHMQCSSLA